VWLNSGWIIIHVKSSRNHNKYTSQHRQVYKGVIVMYTYKAKLIRAVEGDTIDADIDLGFDLSIRQRVKLYGIATPDIKSKDLETKQKALDVKSRLIEMLGNGFVVETVLNKRGKYGRVMGIVYIEDSSNNLINVNKLLIEEGLAMEYLNGGK